MISYSQIETESEYLKYQLWVPMLLEHQVLMISYSQIENEYVKVLQRER